MSTIMRTVAAPTLVGGSIQLPTKPCRHEPARHARPWIGEAGTAGTVAVVGAGKMGLPLAAQFASHGWSVIAIDIDPVVVAAINEGRSHVGDEPGLSELVADAHRAGRLRATLDGAAAAREKDGHRLRALGDVVKRVGDGMPTEAGTPIQSVPITNDS